jgi:multicomponent Na+:H+ antiporter subunit G
MTRLNTMLLRLHATSIAQSLGLLFILGGCALLMRSWAVAGLFALVLFAQMVGVPIASTMMGRAAFRRGFLAGAHNAVDQLTPRLVGGAHQDQDQDGFADEYTEDLTSLSQDADPVLPSNVVDGGSSAGTEDTDLSAPAAWDEPEDEEAETETGEMDIDLEDETETELEEIAERHGH